MKIWMKKQWLRFKSWVYGILAALGIVVGGLALAVPVDYSWTNPTQNTDGSVFDPATELAEIRIYCEVDPAGFVPETPTVSQSETPKAVSLGDATGYTIDHLPGTHSCFATAFDVYGYESSPSGVSVKVVERFPPNPPDLSP